MNDTANNGFEDKNILVVFYSKLGKTQIGI